MVPALAAAIGAMVEPSPLKMVPLRLTAVKKRPESVVDVTAPLARSE